MKARYFALLHPNRGRLVPANGRIGGVYLFHSLAAAKEAADWHDENSDLAPYIVELKIIPDLMVEKLIESSKACPR